jgi:cytochrome c oxidase subunit 2
MERAKSARIAISAMESLATGVPIREPDSQAIASDLPTGWEHTGAVWLAFGRRMRRRVWRWMPLGLAALLALTGCGTLAGKQSLLQPAGPVAAAQLTLLDSSMWIMFEIFVVVAAVLVIALIRFRARPGQTELPPQVEGNNRLELLWTIVPALLLALLAVGTVKETFALNATPGQKDTLQVNVTGHQFWWEFQYPGYSNLTTANELHIPVGEKVVLGLTSVDVMHSFWVPELGGKTDLIPGKENYIWIEATKPGIYYGQCAEFCGTGHADMRLTVDVQTPQEFSAWVQTMEHPQSQPTTALAKEGYKYFGTVGCSACHTIGGTPYAGAVGPNLTDLTGRLMIAANVLPNTPANLYRWIHDPQAVKPGAKMPDLGLKPPVIRAIVAYLEDLK